MTVRVLVAVDDAALFELCRECGFEAGLARPGADARAKLLRDQPDVAILLAADVKAASVPATADPTPAPGLVAAAPTALLSELTALLESGACADVLPLPADRTALQLTVARALARRGLLAERDQLRRERGLAAPVLGDARTVKRLHESVERVASTPRTTVLLTGGSGESRRAVARRIHERGARAAAPFLELCERAFASADPDRALTSLLGAAQGGTVLIDDVAELGPQGQALLLALLSASHASANRPGGRGSGGLHDVRIVVGTAADLEARTRSGEFSEELLYRLNVLSIEVPPLGEPAPQEQSAHADLGAGAREREHTLAVDDLSLRAVERALIDYVLELTGGNRSETARLLQVNRTTLYNKLRAYGD